MSIIKILTIVLYLLALFLCDRHHLPLNDLAGRRAAWGTATLTKMMPILAFVVPHMTEVGIVSGGARHDGR